MSLTKEEKKALKLNYVMEKEKNFILSREEAEGLFDYLDEKLEENGCDSTLRYTMEWLDLSIDREIIPSVLAEIEEMGGYCDCEVILNCYEDYDLA